MTDYWEISGLTGIKPNVDKNIVPYDGDNKDVGESDDRWENVYANNVDASGDVSAQDLDASITGMINSSDS